MTKLRVIVGFAAAATATMTAVDHAKAEHLRSIDEGRELLDEVETAFLDSFASAEGDSLGGDVWGADSNADTNSSSFGSLNDALNTTSTEPTKGSLPPSTTTTPAATDISTMTPTKGPSDGLASDTPTSNESPGSGSTIVAPAPDPTDTLRSVTNNGLTYEPATHSPISPPTTNSPSTDAPATVDTTASPDVPTETPAATDASTTTPTTPQSAAPASELPVATEPAGSSGTIVATAIDVSYAPAAVTPAPTRTPSQVTEVAPWKQCGGLNFDYMKYFADGTSPNWSTKLNCTEGYTCEVVNPWYYQCRAVEDTNTVEQWGQCGGVNYHGLTHCVSGYQCKYVNDWYSQCVPKKTA